VVVDPRVRRRVLEEGLVELGRLRGPAFEFEAFSPPVPDRFLFKFRLRSVMALRFGQPVYSAPGHVHVLEFIASPYYPDSISNDDIRFVTAPVFHPNVFSSGKVCVGGFVPSESLGRFALRIGRMIKFEPAYINEHSAANSDAAAWYVRNLSSFPVDSTVLPSVDKFVAGPIRRTFIPGAIKK
jgi:hypothetical protein